VLLQDLKQHTAFGSATLVAARAAHLGAVAMGNARNRNRNHPRLESTRRTGLAAS
jgi:hypothetical protein